MGKPKKAVVQLEIDTEEVIAIFDSVGSASRATYVSENAIRAYINGRTKNPVTYKWVLLEKYKKDHNVANIEIIKSYNRNDSRAVIQYDLQGNKLGEYSSMNEAYRKTGVLEGSIHFIASGKQKKIDKYIWKFAEDYRN